MCNSWKCFIFLIFKNSINILLVSKNSLHRFTTVTSQGGNPSGYWLAFHFRFRLAHIRWGVRGSVWRVLFTVLYNLPGLMMAVVPRRYRNRFFFRSRLTQHRGGVSRNGKVSFFFLSRRVYEIRPYKTIRAVYCCLRGFGRGLGFCFSPVVSQSVSQKE